MEQDIRRWVSRQVKQEADDIELEVKREVRKEISKHLNEVKRQIYDFNNVLSNELTNTTPSIQFRQPTIQYKTAPNIIIEEIKPERGVFSGAEYYPVRPCAPGQASCAPRNSLY